MIFLSSKWQPQNFGIFCLSWDTGILPNFSKQLDKLQFQKYHLNTKYELYKADGWLGRDGGGDNGEIKGRRGGINIKNWVFGTNSNLLSHLCNQPCKPLIFQTYTILREFKVWNISKIYYVRLQRNILYKVSNLCYLTSKILFCNPETSQKNTQSPQKIYFWIHQLYKQKGNKAKRKIKKKWETTPKINIEINLAEQIWNLSFLPCQFFAIG